MQQLSQQPLSAAILHFHRERQRPCELDEAVIEKRLARFETDCHAGAIDFDEDVVGKIRDLIEVHHSLDRVERPRPARTVEQRQIGLAAADDEGSPMRDELEVHRVVIRRR